MRARARAGATRRFAPATCSEPLVAGNNPHSIRNVVVLPAPLGPNRPKISPRRTSNEVLATAVKSPKRRTRSLTTMTGSAWSVTGKTEDDCKDTPDASRREAPAPSFNGGNAAVRSCCVTAAGRWPSGVGAVSASFHDPCRVRSAPAAGGSFEDDCPPTASACWRSISMKASSSSAGRGCTTTFSSNGCSASSSTSGRRMKRTCPPRGTASTTADAASSSRACSVRAAMPPGGVATKVRPCARCASACGIPSASTWPAFIT